MNFNTLDTGLILAAGFGSRLKPITNHIPKPLVKVGGKCLIDRAIEHMSMVGIKKIIVNTHYLAHQIHAHLGNYRSTAIEIIISYEPEILETAGGIMNAMRNISNKPMLVMSSDIFIDHSGGEPVLAPLLTKWDLEMMDGLFMLKRCSNISYEHVGDFNLNEEGKMIRSQAFNQFIFAGAYIVSPKMFENYETKKLPLPIILFKSDEQNYRQHKLYGVELTANWFDVGTIARLNYLEEYLRNKDEYQTT